MSTFSIQIKSPGAGAYARGPDLRINRGDIVEISVPSTTAGTTTAGLDSIEAAQRGPWVAYFTSASANLPRNVTVDNLNQIFFWFTNASDYVLIMVRAQIVRADPGISGGATPDPSGGAGQQGGGGLGGGGNLL